MSAPTSSLSDLVDELRERMAVVRRGGSESARQKHLDRGKLLVRDRVDRLLDPGSPFLELNPLAAFGLINSTPHSSLLPPEEMHELLSAMALRSLS